MWKLLFYFNKSEFSQQNRALLLLDIIFFYFIRNEKFADVLLFTSNGDGGCGIPAHRIILSSCSYVSSTVL